MESELNKAAEEYAQDETMGGLAERAFKAGAEWQRERMNELAKQEQPEVDLEEEIDRFLSNTTPIKKGVYEISRLGFKAVARHFYELGQRTKYQQDREEFAKLKAKEWQSGYDEGYAKGLNARKEE